MRRGETGIAPAVLAEKGSGGGGHALLEKTDVCETIGKGTGFCCRGWSVHSVTGRWLCQPRCRWRLGHSGRTRLRDRIRFGDEASSVETLKGFCWTSASLKMEQSFLQSPLLRLAKWESAIQRLCEAIRGSGAKASQSPIFDARGPGRASGRVPQDGLLGRTI
jgi:hypothetical protein